MSMVNMATLAVALTAVAGTGAAVIPAGEAQAPAPEARPQVRVAPRPAPAFGGAAEIGVSIREVEEQDAKGPTGGALVADVVAGGPAEKAGVKSGDIFVEFDGERVRSARQFTRLVQETPVGRRVQVAVMRGGQRMNLTIEPRAGSGFGYRLLGDLGDMRVFEDLGDEIRRAIPPSPPNPPVPPAAPVPPSARPDIETYIWRGGNALGITATDLSPQLADYFGTKDGVLVSTVNPDSAAAKAGVKAGDVVTSVNGTNVGSPSQLRREVQRLDDGAEFTIGVMRDKKSVTLKGKMESRRARRTFRS